MKSTYKPKSTAKKITVVIVESHQHALEHIHEALRCQKLVGQTWSMLHLDSHPDLACPNHVPAIACFLPRQQEVWIDGVDNVRAKNSVTCFDSNDVSSRGPTSISSHNETEDDCPIDKDGRQRETSSEIEDLYGLLDTTASGIAEWILPLVFAANLSRIIWVKPSFASQLPIGHHAFHVGALQECRRIVNNDETSSNGKDNDNTLHTFMDLDPSSRIKVDWDHPYYLDDDSFVTTRSLVLPKRLDLDVLELSCNGDKAACKLPIDFDAHPWSLDICLDYFTCINPFLQEVENADPILFDALDKVIRASKCYIYSTMSDRTTQSTNNISSSYRQDSLQFRQLLADFLQRSGPVDVGEEPFSELLTYYGDCGSDTTKRGEELLSKLHKAAAKSSNVLKAIEALPFWTMPHARSSLRQDQIVESLRQVQNLLVLNHNDTSPPFLITIARSSVDGFTHVDRVEGLQQNVLDMLRVVYCCDDHTSPQLLSNSTMDDATCTPSYSLQVVRDYGPWEGSTIAT